jgi:hypothetical protein
VFHWKKLGNVFKKGDLRFAIAALFLVIACKELV